MRSADRILDLGPGAGEYGGSLIAAGTYGEIAADPHSLTGRYLSGHLAIQLPAHRREAGEGRIICAARGRTTSADWTSELSAGHAGRDHRRLRDRGRALLIHEVLYKALSQAKGEADAGSCAGLFQKLEGEQHLTDVVLVDQSPIGRTPRSNPVTYIKAFDAIRELYAAQPEAKKRGSPPGTFRSTFPAAAAKSAKATAWSPSRCSSWPTSNWSARNATARATSLACSK